MPLPTASATLRFVVGVFLVAALLVTSTAAVAEGVNGRISTGGVKRYRAGHWGLVQGAFYNTTDKDETVTTVVTPKGTSGAQYARSLVIPARTIRTTAWPVLVEPGNPEAFEFQALTLRGDADSQKIVNVTGGDFTDTFIASNAGSDSPGLTGYCGLISTRTESQKEADEIDKMRTLARTAAQLKMMLLIISPEELHGYAEALEPIDQLLISSPDLSEYPEACDAIRTWIQRGGRVVFLMDQCGGPTLAAIMGEALPFTVIDKTTPMAVPLQHDAAELNPQQGDLSHVRTFDEPVSLTRAVFETGRVHFSVRGWPAMLEAPLGQGTVFVSTVSPEVLLNPESGDGLDAITKPFLEAMFRTPEPRPLLAAEDLSAASEKRIGYEIPGRGFAALVLTVFTVLLGGVGLIAWKQQRPALLLLGIPLLSIAAAGPGVMKGNASRSVAPPTVIESRIVVLGDGQAIMAADGTSTVYQPSVNESTMTLPAHTLLSPRLNATTALRQRYVWTDTGESHWAGFSQPAGATSYLEQSVIDLPEPMTALTAFGKDSVTVTLSNAESLQPQDALLASLSPDRMALQSQGNGEFVAGPADVLAPGEVSKETLLSESQIMHGNLLQTALQSKDRLYRFPRVPSVLFWTHQIPASVTTDDESIRSESLCLIALPLRFQIPPASEQITIPTTFLPYRAVRDIDGGISSAYSNRQSKWSARENGGHSMLRFRLPDVCHPFDFESAELQLRILAGSRTVTVQSGSPQDLQVIETLESPVGNFTIPVTGDALNASSDGGSFLIRIGVSSLPGEGEGPGLASAERDDDWKIERVLMTVRGHRTSAAKSKKETDTNE